ncbi:MAG: hypothetical protein U1E91_00905 [Moraxella sp.]
MQSFQLIYGGRVSDIRVKNCLQAMSQLEKHGFIDAVTHEQLAQAYRFYVNWAWYPSHQ